MAKSIAYEFWSNSDLEDEPYIQHYSQIQIDPKILQHEFRRAFNETLAFGDPLRLTTLPYVQAKLLPQSDWTTIMRQYIRKGMSA